MFDFEIIYLIAEADKLNEAFQQCGRCYLSILTGLLDNPQLLYQNYFSFKSSWGKMNLMENIILGLRMSREIPPSVITFFILSCFNPLSPLITMKWGFHFHTVVHRRFHLHPHCAWGPCTRGRMRSTDTLSPCCIDIYNPTQTPALSRHNCCTKIILCAEINPAYTCHVSAWRLSQWNHTYTGQRWNWYRITMSAQCLNQPTLQMHGLDQNTGG